ncbi:hypothetical protein DHW03_09945 [Pedobacter yonginense]|uniref:FAD-dependent oxidoreductase n=1 Tax=Pedobacter yonginense TaxID=651869 RepID=A0A317EN92_9SPHI|nr:hypothetical protein [Pedobacter yonginense]PWS27885.1 hypothetical protein DHW03_09945 [Pedobacter yonginense]
MKRLFFVFALLVPLIIHAQTIKTDVLVIGNGDAALAAGMQSYKSGVKTVILSQSSGFISQKSLAQKSAEIQKLYQILSTWEVKKSAQMATPPDDKKNKNLKKTIDSSTFLNVIHNVLYTEISRAGNGWDLKLANGQSLKAKILVLVDNPAKVLGTLKIKDLALAKTEVLSYSNNLYRTTIAAVSASEPRQLSLYNLLITNQENLLHIPPGNIEIGQATGATAAYAAFFETKTSLSNLKRIQGELLSYKLALMPFDDVKATDSNWLAIQKIGVTGILKAELKNGKAYFNPEALVTYDEIKQPVKDYYYKAQIWFDDHKNVPINLENTVSLVAYTGNKSVEATKTELQKKWNKNYKFASKYDLKKNLSRREFSVIINEYLKPFDDVNVDKTGRVIR